MKLFFIIFLNLLNFIKLTKIEKKINWKIIDSYYDYNKLKFNVLSIGII